MLKRITAIAATIIAAVAVPAAAPAQQFQRPSVLRDAPRKTPGRELEHRFIVTLAPRTNARQVASDHGIKADFVYERVISGFAGSLSDLARSNLLRDNRIVRIEPDREALITSTANSWGIDRIDQHTLPLDMQYNPPATGTGVYAYVVDTGIRFDHQMFGGRAMTGTDVVGDGRNGNDCNGHGTHVAGTIGGGGGYGVAPDTSLVSVRVLGCDGSGSVSGIIYALDWISKYGRKPGVVNMSLGGGASQALDDAVTSLVNAGFTTVVAAGNDNISACNQSPARAPAALTIAASDKYDARASFSNYGSCVDLFAPGVYITSAYNTSTTALAQMSGTSMASPHAAGRAALLLQANPTWTPSQVVSSVLSTASAVTIGNAAGSPSKMLYTGSSGTTAPPPTSTPPPGSTSGITIALSYNIGPGGRPIVAVRWSGATTSNVDIYKNGAKTTTTANDGLWSQVQYHGTYNFKVCNAGSSTCSLEVPITV